MLIRLVTFQKSFWTSFLMKPGAKGSWAGPDCLRAAGGGKPGSQVQEGSQVLTARGRKAYSCMNFHVLGF